MEAWSILQQEADAAAMQTEGPADAPAPESQNEEHAEAPDKTIVRKNKRKQPRSTNPNTSDFETPRTRRRTSQRRDYQVGQKCLINYNLMGSLYLDGVVQEVREDGSMTVKIVDDKHNGKFHCHHPHTRR